MALTGCGKNNFANATGHDKKTVYRTVDELKADGTINIGVFSDKNPFGYVDENGEYQGYDVYFADRIGKDLGIKINYVSTEAANRVEYLETGKVDIILANFTVTEERAQKVDFALPYMNVALGVVSPEKNVIKNLDDVGKDDQVIVISDTTAETFLEENYPDIKLQKFDTYASAKTSFENGTGIAWANDNTEVIAYANENSGYVVGIPSFGSQDTIAPAVSKGNESLLGWLNDEIKKLGEENFFHEDYEKTLLSTYGKDYEETLVVEGGVTEKKIEGIVPGNGETIKVAASSVPHAEILGQAKSILANYGYNLEIVEFDDYVQPNLVVESGEFDANYFQHVPYIARVVENSLNEVGAGIIEAAKAMGANDLIGLYYNTTESLTNWHHHK